MTDEGSDRKHKATGAALFAIVLMLIGWDLITDYGQNVSWLHLSVEVVTLLTAALGTAVLWSQYVAAREEARVLSRDLEVARAEGRRWRLESRELLEGLGAAIERQFHRWELSPAEAEIGTLLLKGLSHKEIAGIRRTSERTVRQQAQSLYLKAGLAGRSELSAFFLEDLLLPLEPQRPEAGGGGRPGRNGVAARSTAGR